MKFAPPPPRDNEQVKTLCEAFAQRIIRCLQRKGLLPKTADLTEVEQSTPDNLHELYQPMAKSIKASISTSSSTTS